MSEESSNPSQENPAETLASPGCILRNARKNADLDRDEVAAALNLTKYQVTALEEDRYSVFHGDTYIKGYLRSYGRYLEIDTNQLIDAYKQQLIFQGVEQPKSEGIKPVPTLHRGHTGRYIGVAVALLALVAFFLWQQAQSNGVQSAPAAPVNPIATELEPVDGDQDGEMFEPTLESTLQPNEEPQSALEPESDEAITDTELSLQADYVEPVVDAPLTAIDTMAAQAEQFSNESSDSADSESAESLSDSLQDQLDRLAVSFSDQCWVKITDADGSVLAADLKREGDQLSVTGRAPFRVVLGYAAAAQLELNGSPYTFSIPAGKNAARLTVGSS